ncbi:hypothetical protein FACS1894147_07530 [Spirochaetia bacterium]|nr:hypothetical protein FACS1894147_07530 [Spirochaetia bacterium]
MNNVAYINALHRIVSSAYFNAAAFVFDADRAAALLEHDMGEHLCINAQTARLLSSAIRDAMDGAGELPEEKYLAFIAGRIQNGAYTEKTFSPENIEIPLENEFVALPNVPWKMSRYPVLQHEFEKIMGYNPAYIKGANFPQESVDWYEAGVYCEKRSALEGCIYRLPTRAEWEYAVEAGDKESTWNWRIWSTQPEVGNSNAQHICPAGRFPPNPWGLYDMFGNVWELCGDFVDGKNPSSGDYVWKCGGSYQTGKRPHAEYCKAKRHGYSGAVGMRLVRE